MCLCYSYHWWFVRGRYDGMRGGGGGCWCYAAGVVYLRSSFLPRFLLLSVFQLRRVCLFASRHLPPPPPPPRYMHMQDAATPTQCTRPRPVLFSILLFFLFSFFVSFFFFFGCCNFLRFLIKINFVYFALFPFGNAPRLASPRPHPHPRWQLSLSSALKVMFTLVASRCCCCCCCRCCL